MRDKRVRDRQWKPKYVAVMKQFKSDYNKIILKHIGVDL